MINKRPKLPQHIEDMFNQNFPDVITHEFGAHSHDDDMVTDCTFFYGQSIDAIKSFIATILDEEREKAFINGFKEGNRMLIDWNVLSKRERDWLINLIKEDK